MIVDLSSIPELPRRCLVFSRRLAAAGYFLVKQIKVSQESQTALEAELKDIQEAIREKFSVNQKFFDKIYNTIAWECTSEVVELASTVGSWGQHLLVIAELHGEWSPNKVDVIDYGALFDQIASLQDEEEETSNPLNVRRPRSFGSARKHQL